MNIMNHKTKIVGVIGIVVGFLQMDPRLKNLMDPVAYEWLQVLLGLATVVCGFLNTRSQNSNV